MLKILICLAFVGQPTETEVCYVTETMQTQETFCMTAGAWAIGSGRISRRVTFCRLFDGRLKP